MLLPSELLRGAGTGVSMETVCDWRGPANGGEPFIQGSSNLGVPLGERSGIPPEKADSREGALCELVWSLGKQPAWTRSGHFPIARM